MLMSHNDFVGGHILVILRKMFFQKNILSKFPNLRKEKNLPFKYF
jgi:hypothetical protein